MTKPTSSGFTLAGYAINNPVTISLLFISMLLFGVVASRLLPLEKFPGIDVPEIFIQIPYQNSTPEEIERTITRPVEEAIATMSGIKYLNAVSFEDKAEIYVEFAWDANISAKSIEAREKIDAIAHLLPDDVERILVFKFNTNDMPIFQLRVSSSKDLSNSYDLLERNLKKPLERVPGVSRVELYGVMKKQISISILPNKLTALHVDTATLGRRLRESNFSMTAGHFISNGQKILVNPQGEFKDISDIENLLIQPGVRLKDIATVQYELPERDEGRHLDKTYAVGFNVFRESGSNLVDVSKRVMNVIDEVNQDPEFNGINLFVMDDTAKSVTSSLSDLITSGIIGAVLSIGVLFLFLRHLTSTLIVVLSVPFSICITLGCMYLMGYTLNILSLMGLLLAVGMLVDNAVVVTESVFQQRMIDNNAKRATKAGVSKVSLAIIAGTATTTIVFLPNIIGVKIDLTVFLEHVAIAICISLFASLVIAQTLIPLLASKIAPPKPSQLAPAFYIKAYSKALNWTMNHQFISSIIAVVLLVSVIIPITFVPSDEEDGGSKNRIWLNYHIQHNYSLEEVEKTVNKMESYLYDNQDNFEIKQVYTYFRAGHATSGITLKDNMTIPIEEVKKRINENMPTFVRAKPSFKWNEGNGGGIRITLMGESSKTLKEIANQIVPMIANIDGLTDVRADLGTQRDEIQIKIDREKAYKLGLNTEEISTIVATALRGNNLRTFRYGDAGEVAIRMMYGDDIQASLAKLKNINISQNGERKITLDMVASFNVAPQLSQINRYFRQTAISIGANQEKDFSISEAKAQIEKVMGYVVLPEGYKWTLNGSFSRQDEAFSLMIVNMLLAVCMIYIVMAALFESIMLPTAVITSLLYSFTGAFWAFLITGTPITTIGLIGILILIGIVVNNGIVLVDRINQLIEEGEQLIDAVVKGCESRIRPILMTVATTVLGLVPLALGSTRIGGDGPTYSPMAIAIIGGLLLSTITSLFLVPLTYVLLLKLRFHTTKLFQRSNNWVNSKIKV